MGSILRKVSRHVRRVIELRKLARSTKSLEERNTALAIANSMVSKHKLDEKDVEEAERIASVQTDEDVTVLLHGDMARTLWAMGVVEAIANLHGLLRYKKHAPPSIFVFGVEVQRALCLSDVEAVIAAMLDKAKPHSVAMHPHVSFLEGMAWGFGSTVESVRDALLKKSGALTVRPARAEPDEPDEPDEDMPAVQAGPPQPIIRPDTKLPPNLDLWKEGAKAGALLANRYIGARMDKQGRPTGLALRWKR